MTAVRDAAIAIRRRETGIETKGLGVIADGLAMFAQGGERDAAAMMDFGSARLEVERLGEADQGAVIFPAADVGQPLPKAGGRIGRGAMFHHGFRGERRSAM